jgi:peptide/nickel transport system ATP-binding protein
MIAMMLIPEPEVLIADEPTSALDVTVQAQLLALIDELIRRRGMALILISHNLNLVAAFCDRVLVMYAGQVLESCRAADLASARHPYTRGLLACRPLVEVPRAELPTLARDPAWLAPARP